MGYTTDFDGELTITPPLEPAQVAYLNAFNTTRRVRRNPEITAKMADPKRIAVGLPIGKEGGYYVGDASEDGFGQSRASDIVDYNQPPGRQPGLWCHWCVSDDGTTLQWDGGVKFYEYTEWLEYIAEHFIKRWGRQLNGNIHWHGEDSDDTGVIYAKDNQIEAVADEHSNRGPSWAR